MKSEYTKKGQVSIDMTNYVDVKIESMPTRVASLWNENLFTLNETSQNLNQEKAENSIQLLHKANYYAYGEDQISFR